MRGGLVLVLVAGLALLGGCTDEQDPGVPDRPSNTGPSTTSHLLGACPTGTSASLPTEGCLDDDGQVIRP